jgi:hypothetical protein
MPARDFLYPARRPLRRRAQHLPHTRGRPGRPNFAILTVPGTKQRRALELIGQIRA